MMFDFFGKEMRREAQEKEAMKLTESLRERATQRKMRAVEESVMQPGHGAYVTVTGGGGGVGAGGSGGSGRVCVESLPATTYEREK